MTISAMAGVVTNRASVTAMHAFVHSTTPSERTFRGVSVSYGRKGARLAVRPRARPVLAKAASTVESASDEVKKRELLASTLGGMATDANVPEGHVGLHGLLYGEGGAEAHDAVSVYEIRTGEDDGSTVVSMGAYVEARDAEKPLGVYAVYDSAKTVQYVGYSRNVVVALKTHAKRLGAETCAFTRVMVFANKSMASRSNMEAEVKDWIVELGVIPPGNSAAGREMWDEFSVDTEAFSEAELAEYEGKKLKMRKAMGENLYDDVQGETMDAKERRLTFLQAVEGDDWSEVIDGQTKQTGEQTAPAVTQDIVSPFSKPGKVEVKEDTTELLELTMENVDLVLDEVRPYLIADGGNVEVALVENGIIGVRLQGACGTCPSSTATMSQGIEKALRKSFGDAMKELVQVDKIDISASVMAVNTHLDVLRPAIANYGGTIDVIKVENGKCTIVYTGPPQIAVGITSAIKDKFHDIKDITYLDA